MLPCVPLSPLLFLCLQGYFCQFPKQIGYIISFFSSFISLLLPTVFSLRFSLFSHHHSTTVSYHSPPFPTIPHRFPPFPTVSHRIPTVSHRLSPLLKMSIQSSTIESSVSVNNESNSSSVSDSKIPIKAFFYWLLLNSVWCSIY